MKDILKTHLLKSCRGCTYFLITAFIMLVFVTCHKNNDKEESNQIEHYMAKTELINNTEAMTSFLNTISRLKVFFGHMSVGNQILGEIERLSLEKNVDSLRILKTRSVADFDSPVFGHSNIGRNQFPFEKTDDFVNLLDNGIGSKIDMAIFKFCYTDIRVQTDVDSLFSYYKQKMVYLQSRYPNVRFIHFTVPIMIRSTGLKGMLKSLTGYDHNKNRDRFNELIRKEYPSDCVFDIALFESSYPDGSLERYGIRKSIPGLIPAYTNDGGHLNETGKLLITLKFLDFLSLKNTQ